ncbi:MAG: hypothetical protein ABEJ91_03640 [Candidatus Nanohaloarchaea archaeon]
MGREEISRKLKERFSDAVERLPEVRKRYVALITLVAVGMVFFQEYFIGFLLVAATVTFGVLSKRAELNRLGLELATFSTVLAGYHFGPETGAVMGLILMLSQMLTGRPGVYILWVIPTYAVAGYAAGFFSGTGIATLGTAIAAGMQVVFIFFTALLSRGRLGEYLQYAAFNFAFNLILFHAIGPLVLELLNLGPIY